MAVLEHGAETHCEEFKEQLGFTRERRLHATMIGRAPSAPPLADFSQALLEWMKRVRHSHVEGDIQLSHMAKTRDVGIIAPT